MVTLFLMVGFSASFVRDLGMQAVPWIISLWVAWGLGVFWVRAHGWR